MEQKLDKILEEINQLKVITSETREKLDPITEKVSKLEENHEIIDEKVYELQCQVANLEQYGMKNDLIISGLPEEKEEEDENRSKRNVATKNAVINLVKKLGIEVEEKDIATVHRLPVFKSGNGESRKIPNIIVRFVYAEKKQQIIAASKEKRIKNKDQGNIYCSDHLSQYTWEMLKEARRYRDEGLLKYAWCRDGKVLIREDDKSKAIRLWSCSQLINIVRQIYERKSRHHDPENQDDVVQRSNKEKEEKSSTSESKKDKRADQDQIERELRKNINSKYRDRSISGRQTTMHSYAKANKNKNT